MQVKTWPEKTITTGAGFIDEIVDVIKPIPKLGPIKKALGPIGFIIGFFSEPPDAIAGGELNSGEDFDLMKPPKHVPEPGDPDFIGPMPDPVLMANGRCGDRPCRIRWTSTVSVSLSD